MAVIILNIIAIIICLFMVSCIEKEDGRIIFYVILILLNGGVLGYNICKVINGLE